LDIFSEYAIIDRIGLNGATLMSDKEQKQESTSISPEPTPMNKKRSTELSEEELNKVAGGVAGPIAKKV
jgi:hypothetical protein